MDGCEIPKWPLATRLLAPSRVFVRLSSLVFFRLFVFVTSDLQHMTDLLDDDLLKHIENVRGKVLLITGMPNLFSVGSKYGGLTLLLLSRWCKRAWKGMC